MVWRFPLSGENEIVFGGPKADTIDGGPGTDLLFGGGGPDTFVFHRGDGQDYLFGFEHGADKLEMHASIRTVSLEDTPQGLQVWYGSLGQHVDGVLVVNVHHLDLSDFTFV